MHAVSLGKAVAAGVLLRHRRRGFNTLWPSVHPDEEFLRHVRCDMHNVFNSHMTCSIWMLMLRGSPTLHTDFIHKCSCQLWRTCEVVTDHLYHLNRNRTCLTLTICGKISDAVKRYSYLLGQTELFKHFVDIKVRRFCFSSKSVRSHACLTCFIESARS